MLTRPVINFLLGMIVMATLLKKRGNVFAISVKKSVDDSCTFFYKPCECFTYSPQTEMQIICRNLTPQQVFDIFNQDSIPLSDITFFVFEMSDPTETSIPANLLGTHRVVSSISLKWTASDAEGLLKIDPDAFRSSGETLLYFNIDGFNARTVNWSFLSTFVSLLSLQTSNLIDMKGFSSLPTLAPNLTSLYVNNCTDLINIPNVGSELLVAEFLNSTTDDKSASRILGKLLRVNETLQQLVFNYALLSVIPLEIRMFPNVRTLTITNTDVSLVQEGAFNFNADAFSTENLRQISLKGNKLEAIMPGAFVGSLRYAVIHLEDNFISHFEAPVYQPILEDIYNSTKGGLYMENNPLVCDCDIAWLIRDNRHLLDYVFGATCSDTTPFAELDPESFSSCK